MTKLVLPFLETMATQACNLSCTGCTNYSDLPHKGYVSWSELESQLSAWLPIVDIPDFGIMGGEPLLNPEIADILRGVRKLMPDAQIRFTTNGKNLYRHKYIIDLLHELGNVVFKITVHQPDAHIDSMIRYIFKKYQWTPIHEYGIDRWSTSNNFRFQINCPDVFIKTYRNSYVNMLPYESDPVQSFDLCIQKTCPLLYQGRIYKCSTQALLSDTLHKVGKPNYAQWEPYLHTGISPESEIAEIEKFINNFGKPHSMCKMCPTVDDQEALVPHQLNVSNQKYVRIRRKILR